jgi:hypothetical protein
MIRTFGNLLWSALKVLDGIGFPVNPKTFKLLRFTMLGGRAVS